MLLKEPLHSLWNLGAVKNLVIFLPAIIDFLKDRVRDGLIVFEFFRTEVDVEKLLEFKNSSASG